MLSEFTAYLVDRRRSPHTIRLRLTYIRQYLAACDFEAATMKDVEGFLYSHEWKPETFNAALTSIRVFYKWAIREKYATTNPTELVEFESVPRQVKTLADDNAIRHGLTNASLVQEAILRLGRECGLRRTEIATLRIEDRTGMWLHVTGKGRKTRRLKAQGRLLEVLISLEAGRDGYGYYFPGVHDGHMPPDTVYRTVLRLTGTPTHALRRRGATSVYKRNGRDIRVTQEWLGHSNPATSAIYIDVSEEDLSNAGDAALLDAA